MARFHLGTGARIYAVRTGADLNENGVRQSIGAMVNDQYDIGLIEQNYGRFVRRAKYRRPLSAELRPMRQWRGRKRRATCGRSYL